MAEQYQTEFQIIALAGDARSAALLAIRAAREGNPDGAAALLEEAQTQLLEAHHVQTEMIQAEARGEAQPANVIMIHAQDHFSGAQVTISLAEELIHLYASVRALQVEGAHA